MLGTPKNNDNQIVAQFCGELAHLSRSGALAPAPVFATSFDNDGPA